MLRTFRGAGALLCLALAACLAGAGRPSGTPRVLYRHGQAPAQNLLHTYAPPVVSMQRAGQWALGSTVAWDSLRRTIGADTSHLLATAVDFTQDRVLVASMGSIGSGGTWITIDSVLATTDGTVAYATQFLPAPGALTSSGMTTPMHVVRVPAVAGDVRFRVRQVTLPDPCRPRDGCEPARELRPTR